MRIGVCASAERWQRVAAVGYDYIEGKLSAIALASDEEFEEMLRLRECSGLDVEACNGFFPGDLSLYATDGNTDATERRIREYVEVALSRANKLGTCVTVLGSSGARSIPDGFSRAEAERQFLRVLTLCGDIGVKYGIAVTVEPLNSKETNFINTFAEGLEFARRASHPSVFAMIDLYHHAVSGEPMSTVDGTRGMLIHAHICRADRTAPTVADREELKAKVDYLKSVGYDGRLSLESKHIPDFETSIRNAYALLSEFR